MYLPSGFFSAFVLMFITMICWGSWGNTAKIDRKWRFELYYIDLMIGVFFYEYRDGPNPWFFWKWRSKILT